MSTKSEAVVQNLLRQSEEVKIALETETIPYSDESAASVSAYDTEDKAGRLYEQRRTHQSGEYKSTRRRIIAIVAHLDSITGDEQACLFYMTPKVSRSGDTYKYSVEHVFPIIDGFHISMAQARRNTIDLSSSAASPLDKQNRTELILTIHSGREPESEPFVLTTEDVQKLRSLLAECKRLRDISVANNEAGVVPAYPWVLPYISRTRPTILSPIPQDLRHAYRPSHTLLSEVAAGTSTPATDVFDISVIREEWVRSQVKQHFYTLDKQGRKTMLKLRIGTFNVNGKMPSQDLSAWVRGRQEAFKYIPPLQEISPFSVEAINKDPMDATADLERLSLRDDTSTLNEHPVTPVSVPASKVTLTSNTQTQDMRDDPDLIVLGFQELDLSTGALLYYTETTREDAWFVAAMAGLGEKAEAYEKLASKQLVGMLLIILVKRDLRDCFTQIQSASAGAGLMGLMGNKGGTALRLTFTPRSTSEAPSPRPAVLTFVNAHLAAFDEMYDKRNADFHDLSKRLLFDSGVPAYDEAAQIPVAASSTVPLNVYQTDALFWMGDLNYRVNLSDSDIRTLLSYDHDRTANIPVLLEHDQLKLASRTEKAFAHFHEFPITHLPSYRFNADASSDGLGYDIKRKPAWTDRVLHMCSRPAHVRQLAYGSQAEITMSDHRPVSAEFYIDIPLLDLEELNAHVHELWKDMASVEDLDASPQLKVEPSSIDFDTIRYKQPISRTLNVSNVGKVASTFRFVPLTLGADVHPKWLHIEPMSALLRPGEHAEIVLSLDISDETAAALNEGSLQLDTLLILHTSLGKDHFISVTGAWARTCFATRLERLVRVAGPVRSPAKLELLPKDTAATAPKEFMRLVSWLMSNATDVDGIFVSPGDESLVYAVRECLDTGADFPTGTDEQREVLCLSAAQCLLQFLASLPDTLAPVSLHLRCSSVVTRDEAFELLNDFPSVSVNVWIAVTSLLHFICQQDHAQSDLGMADRLAAVFATVLLKDGNPITISKASIVGKRNFVKFFIA